ncbi:MAG: hypothetical protein AAF206_06705 [Bacteroidota bacterium]
MNFNPNETAFAENWQDTYAEYTEADTYAEDFDDDDETAYEDYDDEEEGEFVDEDETALFSAEFDDDGEDFDDDEGEIEGEFLNRLLSIRRLAKRRNRGRSSRAYRPRNFLNHRLGRGRFRVNPRSRSRGFIRVGRRRLPFTLPSHIATKADVTKLANQVRKDIRLNSAAIRKNAAGIRSAIGLARKANAGVARVDQKYRKATLQQTRVSNEIRKQIIALKKAQEMAQAQARQQAMLSLFMTPDIESITVKEGDIERKLTVTDSEFETNLLPLVMGMAGNNGGQGGMDPMMMFAMMQTLD